MSQVIVCPHCGIEVTDESAACPHCNAVIDAERVSEVRRSKVPLLDENSGRVLAPAVIPNRDPAQSSSQPTSSQPAKKS